MTIVEVNLDSNEKFEKDSEEIKIEKDKRYVATTEVEGIQGKPFCGYFGVETNYRKNFNQRRIQWLNDFSGNKKKISVNFTAPTDSAIFIYRINTETYQKSPCKLKLSSLEDVALSEVDGNLENFSESELYIPERLPDLTAEQELTLEKNMVWVISSTRTGSTWLATQLLTYQTNHMNEPCITKYLGLQAPPFSDNILDMEFFEHRPPYFFSLKYKKTWSYYLRKLILNRAYAEVLDLSKKVIVQEPGGV